MELSEAQRDRFARNIALSEIGEKGQAKLLESRVLVVGAGGLGSPAALYLAATGVGTIGLMDGDKVELSNLQRQLLHGTADIGRAKVVSARETISAFNPDLSIELHECRLTVDNALDVLVDYDFVIDATDSFPSKFLVADACHFAKKPYAHAGVLRFDGIVLTVVPGETACYRCLFDEPPPDGAVPSCSEVGVPGVVPGIAGVIQAAEAMKYLLGIGDLLTDSLLSYNVLEGRFRSVCVKRNPECRLCGENPTIEKLTD